MTDWLYYLCLIALLLGGLSITLIGLPGLWVMLATAALYAYLTGWIHLAAPGLITLLVLAIAAEIAEFIAGGAGAAEAGGGKRAFAGAIVGGFLGGIFLTFLVPIFVIGTIFGACLGSAVGAIAAEMTRKQEFPHAWRIGWGAFKGRFYGILWKLGFGGIMLCVAVIAALPLDDRPAPSSSPTTSPTTNVPDFPGNRQTGIPQ